MVTKDFFQHLPAQAAFDPDRMRKLDCYRSERLLVGLNCLEPGQSQPVHAHAGADKFYFVVSGRARFTVGGETRDAVTGDLVLAPAGVPHGVPEALARTLLLVAIAPAPAP
jgi:quercetin dioxygenase-like cupin family protein